MHERFEQEVLLPRLAPAQRRVVGVADVMADVGAVVSVDAVAAVKPDISVTGWTLPMSASRFTVACCMITLVAG